MSKALKILQQKKLLSLFHQQRSIQLIWLINYFPICFAEFKEDPRNETNEFIYKCRVGINQIRLHDDL